MTYATVADLLRREAPSDIAEVASPDDCDVTGKLLEALVAEADTRDWDDHVIQLGRQTIDHLSALLAETKAKIDVYVRARYPTLIDRPHPDNADVLRSLSLDLAAYALLGGDRDSDRQRVYNAAIAQLNHIGNGTVRLATYTEAGTAGSGAMAASDKAHFGGGIRW